MKSAQLLAVPCSPTKCRVFGDMAIVQSHVHVKKTTDGKLVENDHTDLDVFAKRNGLTETRTRH